MNFDFRIHYDRPQQALDDILGWLEEHIDLEHCAAVEERHVCALNYEPLSRALITLSAPIRPPFETYPYSQIYHDPLKMLINELVGPYGRFGPTGSIVNSIQFRDDFPLQIRALYGIGVMASLFGATVEQVGDELPWVRPLPEDKVKALVAHGVPGLQNGLVPQVLETMAYFRQALAPYPKCAQAIHLTQPDLQGPLDIADQLWGADMFRSFYEDPQFIQELLGLIAETYIQASRLFAAASTEQTATPGYIYQHFSILPGHCLIKDDSSIMVSPRIYKRFVQPVNEKVLGALGGGCIHFCGCANHWREVFVSTQHLLGVDFGQLYLNDVPAWAATLAQHRLPVLNSPWPYDKFIEQTPAVHFSTGASFVVSIADSDLARTLL